MADPSSLKGTYYENNTIPGICFGSLVLPHAYKLLRYAFLRVPRLQLPNKRVSFGAGSYVVRGHIRILPPTCPPPSNQSIAKISPHPTAAETWAAVQLPDYTRWSCQTAAKASAAAPAGGARRQSGSSAPGVQSLSLPYHGSIWTSERPKGLSEVRPKFLSPNSFQPWPLYRAPGVHTRQQSLLLHAVTLKAHWSMGSS